MWNARLQWKNSEGLGIAVSNLKTNLNPFEVTARSERRSWAFLSSLHNVKKACKATSFQNPILNMLYKSDPMEVVVEIRFNVS